MFTNLRVPKSERYWYFSAVLAFTVSAAITAISFSIDVSDDTVGYLAESAGLFAGLGIAILVVELRFFKNEQAEIDRKASLTKEVAALQKGLVRDFLSRYEEFVMPNLEEHYDLSYEKFLNALVDDDIDEYERLMKLMGDLYIAETVGAKFVKFEYVPVVLDEKDCRTFVDGAHVTADQCLTWLPESVKPDVWEAFASLMRLRTAGLPSGPKGPKPAWPTANAIITMYAAMDALSRWTKVESSLASVEPLPNSEYGAVESQ